MGAYDRYKKDPDGLRKLVELLETTPMKRREELINKGMAEDAAYTKAAVDFIITFQDILQLPEMELTEVIAAMKPKSVAQCIFKNTEEEKKRFLACVQKTRVLEVHSYLDTTPSAVEIGGAKKEAIAMARALEVKGLLSIKKIPKNFNAKDHKPVKSAAKSAVGKRTDISADDLFGNGSDLFSDNLFGNPEESAANKAGSNATTNSAVDTEASVGKKKAS